MFVVRMNNSTNVTEYISYHRGVFNIVNTAEEAYRFTESDARYTMLLEATSLNNDTFVKEFLIDIEDITDRLINL